MHLRKIGRFFLDSEKRVFEPFKTCPMFFFVSALVFFDNTIISSFFKRLVWKENSAFFFTLPLPEVFKWVFKLTPPRFFLFETRVGEFFAGITSNSVLLRCTFFLLNVDVVSGLMGFNGRYFWDSHFFSFSSDRKPSVRGIVYKMLCATKWHYPFANPKKRQIPEFMGEWVLPHWGFELLWTDM